MHGCPDAKCCYGYFPASPLVKFPKNMRIQQENILKIPSWHLGIMSCLMHARPRRHPSAACSGNGPAVVNVSDLTNLLLHSSYVNRKLPKPNFPRVPL